MGRKVYDDKKKRYLVTAFLTEEDLCSLAATMTIKSYKQSSKYTKKKIKNFVFYYYASVYEVINETQLETVLMDLVNAKFEVRFITWEFEI